MRRVVGRRDLPRVPRRPDGGEPVSRAGCAFLALALVVIPAALYALMTVTR
jgi:hypothetical protein